MYMLYDLKS